MSVRSSASMLVARPFATATWRDTGYLLLGAATAWIAFSVLLVTVIGGGLLALTILGLPILLLCFWLVRGTAGLDRRRARRSCSASRSRPGIGRRRTTRSRAWTVVRDPQSWKEIVWLAAGSVLGFTHGIVAGAIWAAGIVQASQGCSAACGRSTAGPCSAWRP